MDNENYVRTGRAGGEPPHLFYRLRSRAPGILNTVWKPLHFVLSHITHFT